MALDTPQLRCEEYQQAQTFVGKHDYPQTSGEAKLYSIAHDIMSAHHDRNFQDLHLLYSSTQGWPMEHVLRIFDLEQVDGTARALVYQFGPADTVCNLDEIINLAVWRGHMRFLYPPSTTRPTAWRDWEGQVNQIAKQEWCSWSERMGRDRTSQQVIDLYPCRICAKPCRFNINEKMVRLGPHSRAHRRNRLYRGGRKPTPGRV